MDHYLLIKSLHIISFTAWMAGMFYLPRLFAYHASVAPNGPEAKIFRVMERRLLKAIMNPAMVLTLGLGMWLVIITGYGSPENPAQWLMAKLVLVFALAGLHGFFAGTVRRFANGQNHRSSRFYKIINEAVTVAFIAIVLLVVIKPF